MRDALLIIDDNEDIIQASSALLSLIGVTHFAALTAEEGLRVLKSHEDEISVVLVDKVLDRDSPDAGITFIEKVIGRVDPNMEFYLLTAHKTSAEEKTRLEHLGVPILYKDYFDLELFALNRIQGEEGDFRTRWNVKDKLLTQLSDPDLLKAWSEFMATWIPERTGERRIIQPELIIPVQQSVRVVNSRIADRFRTKPNLLHHINPELFEQLVAELFEDEGYTARLTPPRKDGGKDLYVFKKDPLAEVMFLVECKRYVPPSKVGVEVARQLYGVVQQERANGGIIVTTSYFTKGAKDFTEKVPYQLFLHDYDYLDRWLKKQLPT